MWTLPVSSQIAGKTKQPILPQKVQDRLLASESVLSDDARLLLLFR